MAIIGLVKNNKMSFSNMCMEKDCDNVTEEVKHCPICDIKLHTVCSIGYIDCDKPIKKRYKNEKG